MQASAFLERTQVDALAVCIGNVHGKYPTSGPKLDLNLLKVHFLSNIQSNTTCYGLSLHVNQISNVIGETG